MDKEIVYSAKNFDVVKKDDKIGIEPQVLSIAILPFTRDEKGLPKELGVLKEYNHMQSRVVVTVITGKAEGEDPDILTAAQRKMFEVSKMDIQEPERWYYLGVMTTHKMINQEIPCWAVDITDVQAPEIDKNPDPDDEVDEKAPEFIIMGVNKALDSSDCFIPTIFMKIFKYIFGFSNGTNEEPEETVKTDPKQKEILKIEGVVGAGKKNNVWTIHIKKGTDKLSIKSKVQQIVGETTSVNVEETDESNLKSE